MVCSTVGDPLSNMGDILSIMRDVKYCGGYHEKCGAQWDPAVKKPLFKNESKPVSYTMRPFLY